MTRGQQLIFLSITLLLLVHKVQTQSRQEDVAELRERPDEIDGSHRSQRFAAPDPDPTIHKSNKPPIRDKLATLIRSLPNKKSKIHHDPIHSLPRVLGHRRAFGRALNAMELQHPVARPPSTSTQGPPLNTTKINSIEKSQSNLVSENLGSNLSDSNSTNGTDTREEDLQQHHERNTGRQVHVVKSESKAKHGEPCNPTNALYPDYCEMAEYPNKGRMICANNKCDCKFGKQKTKMGEIIWVQLRYDAAKEMCVSPPGGVCYVMFPAANTEHGRSPTLIIDKDMAHRQCDDQQGEKLLCAQAHPRRFPKFDQYSYYCLGEKNRAPQLSEEHESSGNGVAYNSIGLIMFIMVLHLCC